jgi:hypothetical protein
MAKLTGSSAGEPVRSQHTLFGDLAAVWSMLERLNLAGVVDEIVPRRSDAAASVGTYIALATANRVVAPCSKAAFAEWWASTAGPRWVKLGEGALDHRRFWKAMDRLDEACLRAIETELGRRMVAEFGLDLCTGGDKEGGADTVTEPARGPVSWVRPDPRQGPCPPQ